MFDAVLVLFYRPITDLSGIYEPPYPAKSYPGFHIYGFSWYVPAIYYSEACTRYIIVKHVQDIL